MEVRYAYERVVGESVLSAERMPIPPDLSVDVRIETAL